MLSSHLHWHLPSLATLSFLEPLAFGVLGLLLLKLVSPQGFDSLKVLSSVKYTLLKFVALASLAPVAAVQCPHCFGNFKACTYETDSKCPTIEMVTANAAIVAAGAGALSLTGIIKPRFLRIFSRVAFDTVLALVKRGEPGTSFVIDENTKSTAILNAIHNGQKTRWDQRFHT